MDVDLTTRGHAVMPDTREPHGALLSGASVLFYSECDFSHRLREFKEALSLHAAGATVTFLGHGSHVPQHLVASPIRVILITPRDAEMVADVGPKLLRRVLDATYHRAKRIAWRVFSLRPTLRRRALELSPDVVHAVDAPSLRRAAWLARLTGARLVYDTHEYWTGFVSNPAIAAHPRWGRAALEAERRYAPLADLVLTTSEDMSEALIKQYALENVVHVYNATWSMDPEFVPAGNPPRFVFHGSVARNRNIGGMLDALSLLRGEWTLDIWGEHHDITKEEVEAAARAVGIGDRVRVHGAFEYSALRDILPGYDVEIYCAQALDGNFDVTLPNKLFDAVVAGLAVAMPDFASIRRIIDREGFGALLDTSTPRSISEGLQQLVDHPEVITEMKRRAVEVSAAYAWEAQGDRVVRAYAAILAGSPRRLKKR